MVNIVFSFTGIILKSSAGSQAEYSGVFDYSKAKQSRCSGIEHLDKLYVCTGK